MHITCPQCTTKFIVKKEQLGAEGRRMRCSKCSHIWFQQISEKIVEKKKQKIQKKITPETRFYDGNARLLPTIVTQPLKKNYRVMEWLLAIFTCLTIIIFSEIFITNSHSNSFSVNNVNIVRVDSGNVLVSYVIKNNTDKPSHLPIMRFRFYDDKGLIIKRFLVENVTTKLEPKQSVSINREFSVSDARVVDVTLGSKLDFLLRY